MLKIDAEIIKNTIEYDEEYVTKLDKLSVPKSATALIEIITKMVHLKKMV